MLCSSLLTSSTTVSNKPRVSGLRFNRKVKNALKTCHIRSITEWTDSTAVLNWFNKQGHFKQFVANRVTKILKKEYVKWYYAQNKQNPADIGSRVSLLFKIPEIY